MRLRRNFARCLLLFAAAACAETQSESQLLGPRQPSDTLRLAFAAATWISPNSPAANKIALVYGAPRGAGSANPAYLGRADAGVVAAMVHATLVQADSVRLCPPTWCTPHDFQRAVQISHIRINGDTGLVIVTTMAPGGKRGFPNWISREARFYRRGSDWEFDSILTMAMP